MSGGAADIATTSSPRNPSKVLVVDLGFLGDTIHLIPALRELRRHHPSSALHVVTTPVGAEVLKLVNGIDRVWVYPLGDPSPPWWRHLGLQYRLFRERFRLAVNFSGADRTLFVTAFAGVRDRVTRVSKTPKFWQRWMAGKVLAAPPRSLPVFEQRRQVLAAAGYELAPARFDLCIPPEEARWAGEHVADGAVHVSINASSPFKEWPVERWAEWIRRHLDHESGEVVATASAKPREQERIGALVRVVGHPRLRTLDGPMSVPRLAAVLARCSLHVGTDSGVTHLAMALGLPTVSVFREYAGLEEWRPRGDRHAAVTAPCGCVDQPRMQPECLSAGAARCLAGIAASEVARLVDRIRAGTAAR